MTRLLNLSAWSFARVLLVGVAWIILVVGWQVFRFYLLYRRMRAESEGVGSGGIGAVSGGIAVPVLFGPPILLLIAWLVLRYRH